MKTKLKVFLSFLLSIGLLIGAIILTIQLAHIPLDLGQKIIDNYGSNIAFCTILYAGFIVCIIYTIYSLYIEYKKKQIDQYYKIMRNNLYIY